MLTMSYICVGLSVLLLIIVVYMIRKKGKKKSLPFYSMTIKKEK